MATPFVPPEWMFIKPVLTKTTSSGESGSAANN
jgi:hypothetical protein